MKTALFRICFCALIIASLFACSDINDYLDKTPTGGLTDVQVFQNYSELDGFVANIYSRISREWFVGPGNEQTIATFTYASASDEGMCSIQFDAGPHNFTNTPISPTFNPLDSWASNYAAIRAANLFLHNIESYLPSNANEVMGKSRLIGEVHFLRAWFYFDLFKQYGGVPIVNKLLNITDNLNLPRNTAQEVVDFIVSDCETAAGLLPPTHNAAEVGRATRGAALMLKAKALLYFASELHNPEGDNQRWTNAANAFQAVIDLNMYQVDHDYGRLFNRRNTANIIFQATRNGANWVWANFPPSLGGNGRGINPLQSMVDSYEMKETGKGIKEAGSGFDAANPYVGRDPRFYHSIVYNGSVVKNTIINTYESALDGIKVEGNTLYTQTGYYLRKTVDQNGSLIPNDIPGDHFWIYMRYEDALLSFAEAKNESLGNPDASVYAAVNAVRTRVSVEMPPLEEGLTKAQMREKIRNERRVELAFEGHRFWDIRRWKIANDVMQEAKGMLITQSGSGYNYREIKVADRVYLPHFDLFPISQSEMNRQPALTQNPGYPAAR